MIPLITLPPFISNEWVIFSCFKSPCSYFIYTILSLKIDCLFVEVNGSIDTMVTESQGLLDSF